jgi:uncharacterized protein (DUF885 family)
VAAAATPTAEDAKFEALGQRFLDEFGRYSPVYATALGDHRFDGDLDDLSAAGRARSTAFARDLLRQLSAIDSKQLSRANQVDAAMLENQLRYAVWSEEKFRDWSWDPLSYTQLAGQGLYGLLAREYAPLPERLRSVTSRLEKLPLLLEQMRANLVPARVPAIHAETVVKQNPGVLSLVDELVVPNVGVLPEGDRVRLERAIERARAAVQQHQQWLEKELLPNARGEFRIGRELYDEKLALALMSPLSRQEIRARAEAEVERVRAEMYSTARQALAGREDAPPMPQSPGPAEQQAVIAAALELAYAERPSRDGVVPLARETLEETTAFVREKGFVTMPDEPLEIIVMPEFQRGVAVAYCDSPGPLDKGQRTFYAVSPIPEDWQQSKVDSFLREYNDRSIANLTIHEAMPGHYLQLAHSNQYPSVLRAMLGSGPFIEGCGVCRAGNAGAGLSRGRSADEADPAQVVPARGHERDHRFRDPRRRHGSRRSDEADDRDRLPGRERGRREVGARTAHVGAAVDLFRRLPGARGPAPRRRGPRGRPVRREEVPRPAALLRLAAGALRASADVRGTDTLNGRAETAGAAR